MSSNPIDLSAVAAAEAIASRHLTSEALTKACLARIQAREADVRAWAHLDVDYALSQARAADKKLAGGEPLGALHGVPVGVKDIIDVAGLGCEHGSAMFAGRMPEHDALCVAALRSAGAIILGKTVTTELANRSANQTRNPHNLAHTPGGSSSGSAAGIADRMMPLALGTQTAGSVIRPASYCGIHGIKPTLGTIPRGGALLQSHTLDTIGLYGRSVEDLALGLDVLSVEEPNDAMSYPRARVRFLDHVRRGAGAKPKLAFVRSPVWDAGEAAMHTALENYARSLGSVVKAIDLPASFERARGYQSVIMATESAHYYGPLLDAHPDTMSQALQQRLVAGRAVHACDYVDALQAREPLYHELANVLDTFDAILTPSAPSIAPRDLGFTGDPVFNVIWTYLGVPCLNLPLLEIDGMPLGVQLVGKRREDAKLLATARWLEEATRGAGS